MLADLDQKVAGDDEVKLLAVMACKLYVLMLGFLIVAALYIQGLCDPVLECIGKIVISHSMGVTYLLPATGSGYSE